MTHLQNPAVAGERTRPDRHPGSVLWITGLSGAGKSTLAAALMRHLFEQGQQVYVLDGDVLRKGLNKDLGFSPSSRKENIRRAACVAALMADAGLICISAFISPYREDRDLARSLVPPPVDSKVNDTGAGPGRRGR